MRRRFECDPCADGASNGHNTPQSNGWAEGVFRMPDDPDDERALCAYHRAVIEEHLGGTLEEVKFDDDEDDAVDWDAMLRGPGGVTIRGPRR